MTIFSPAACISRRRCRLTGLRDTSFSSGAAVRDGHSAPRPVPRPACSRARSRLPWTMLREFEYKGRRIQTTVLPEQGRWAYRIDDGEMRMVHETRDSMGENDLFAQAKAAAKAEIDGADRWIASRPAPR